MSYIAFTTGVEVFETRRISGTERGWMAHVLRRLAGMTGYVDEAAMPEMLRRALDNEPACRLIARMHGQCELGAWVRAENCGWLARLIRDSCERSVRVPSDLGGEESAELLRVGMSAYGHADLNFRDDRRGPLQTWWSLVEWLNQHGGSCVAMYYSTSGTPWPNSQERGSVYLDEWLRANSPHLEWTPENWRAWRPE